ncbi:unnamed protein product [Symbiodinium natans]|uniref:Uncharacterized protein n=1 Tax=Symbiodinium natans TaxID=878477 RepID=A0A812NWV0_9DINO|nr:unnamed protein product [Symbiodinium natans]
MVQGEVGRSASEPPAVAQAVAQAADSGPVRVADEASGRPGSLDAVAVVEVLAAGVAELDEVMDTGAEVEVRNGGEDVAAAHWARGEPVHRDEGLGVADMTDGPALVLVAGREVAVGMGSGESGVGHVAGAVVDDGEDELDVAQHAEQGDAGGGAGVGADVGAEVGAEVGAAEGGDVDVGGAEWRVAPRSLGRSDWLPDFRAGAEQVVAADADDCSTAQSTWSSFNMRNLCLKELFVIWLCFRTWHRTKLSTNHACRLSRLSWFESPHILRSTFICRLAPTKSAPKALTPHPQMQALIRKSAMQKEALHIPTPTELRKLELAVGSLPSTDPLRGPRSWRTSWRSQTSCRFEFKL